MRDFADRYDAFLIDLWGTVHDGVSPLPGAVSCLTELKRRAKKIILLSNAPRRSRPVIERMTEMGIASTLYDDVLTSGESVYLALAERCDPWHARLGRRCLLIGPPDDDSVIAGLDIARAETVDETDFLLAGGSYRRGDTLADYESLLLAAVRRRLPMICANPDLEVLRGPVREMCAGTIAQRYEQLGGEVVQHGKPHAPIYALSLSRAGAIDRRRILAIGDGLPTDIAGAAAAGIAAVLITGGLHAEALGLRDFAQPDPERLAAFCGELNCSPMAALAALRW